MKGWVYVIDNKKSMPGLVKVGHSSKDPNSRALALGHTGVPHPYSVQYEVLVKNPLATERAVQKYLEDRKEGKEWFRCSTEEAVAAIRAIVGNKALLEDYKLRKAIKARTKAQQARRMAICASQKAQELTTHTINSAIFSAQRAVKLSKRAVNAAKQSAASDGKYKVHVYPGHGSYKGEWDCRYNDGCGVYKWANGQVYQGWWKSGKTDGYGILFFKNGDRYAGEWEDGLQNGYGFLARAGGNGYGGEWVDGIYRGGCGTLTYANGDRYDGELKDGRESGYGIYTYADGSCYEGAYEDGMKSRYGVFTYANGDCYQGEWMEDSENGYGFLTETDRCFNGEWENGRMI